MDEEKYYHLMAAVSKTNNLLLDQLVIMAKLWAGNCEDNAQNNEAYEIIKCSIAKHKKDDVDTTAFLESLSKQLS